jgi:hypothetical protein
VTIEGRRTAVPVHLDGQHGAFHGTNPELGSAKFGDPRSTVASLRTMETTIMISRVDGGRNKEILPEAEIMRRLVAENRSGPVARSGLSLRPPRGARCTGTQAGSFLRPSIRFGDGYRSRTTLATRDQSG